MEELNGKAIERYEEVEDTQKDKFLTFALDQEEYGIDIKYVIEIISMQMITTVPEVPYYVKGIINLRGKIIPVIDVRLRFNKEAVAYDERTCIIVTEVNAVCIGLVVDRVSEVVQIPEEDISDPPEMSIGASNRYLKKIGKHGNKVKLLIDCDSLINDDITMN